MEPQLENLRLAARGASRETLIAILDAMREGVILVDDAMRIAASNRAARAWFARFGERMENRRVSEIFREPMLHEALRGALDEHNSSDLRVEIALPERRTYDIRVAPIDLDGAVNAVGAFYDVTRLERLERVRQEFLSNISHELRTPLTSILAFVETLEDGAIDDPEHSRRFLGVIRRNAERMNGLIADILELSLIESGKISVSIGKVSLYRLVEEVFANLAAKARERKIELRNGVPHEVAVLADAARLEQMLTNLVDNAIKFNRPGGNVEVAFESRSGKDVIIVSDTGEGIVPEHLHRIFERFYRIDRGRTREVGGTGLGLAIVKHLAKLHGGEIRVASELGQGTVFSIELPAE